MYIGWTYDYKEPIQSSQISVTWNFPFKMRLIFFFKDKSTESIFECGGMNFPLCSSVGGRLGVVPLSNVILSFLVHVLTSSSPQSNDTDSLCQFCEHGWGLSEAEEE